MSKPFDATMRELFELEPAAWLEFLGIPVADPTQVKVIDSKVSTITAEADKVVRVDGREPLIVHTEFLTGRDPGYPEQAHWYNTLLGRRHQVPVWTVVVLLRPAADGPELTGTYEREFPGRGKNLWFRHDVVRVWLQAPERLLAAGLPLLPLAPVSDVALERLPDVVMAVAERLRDETGPEMRTTLWTATVILIGLRYPREQVGELMEEVATMVLGIRGIEDSWVYQDILAKGLAKGLAEGEAKGRAEGEAKGRAEGAVQEAHKTLLRLGQKKLGQPEAHARARIDAINDLDRLNLLLDRILEASSWPDLLAVLDQSDLPR
jgi:predicted transposase YdaD